MATTVDAFPTFGKEQMEATVASATAVTKGFQTIAEAYADYSKRVFQRSTETFEKVISANSVERALEVQQAYAREFYEGYLGEFQKIGELYAATAREAYRPFEAFLPRGNGSGRTAK